MDCLGVVAMNLRRESNVVAEGDNSLTAESHCLK
jgi:hypothetical protein